MQHSKRSAALLHVQRIYGIVRILSTFTIGDDLPVRRMGYGAMRIVGQPGNYGQPADRPRSLAVLRAAVNQGVTLIDTAESYGAGVSEELIAEALHPYPNDLVIATKGGVTKRSATDVVVDCSAQALHRDVHNSLRRLRLERIDLYQLHVVDPAVPFEASITALAELQTEGKIRHLGLSNVTTDQLRIAQSIAPIASVQNRYSLLERDDDPMVDLTEAEGIAYLPYGPLGGEPRQPGAPIATEPSGGLTEVAVRNNVTAAQIALAWLVNRASNVIPIPGSTSVDHVVENCAAMAVTLTNEDLSLIETT